MAKKKITKTDEKIKVQQKRVDKLDEIVERKQRRKSYSEKRLEHFSKLHLNAILRLKKEGGSKEKKAAIKHERDRYKRKAQFWHKVFVIREKAVNSWRARERKQRAKLKHLKEMRDEAKAPASGVVVPNTVWNPYKRPIAAWMVPWITKSWNAGWRGVIVSGWRDPVYSESLCYRICGRPSCPGLCAGRSSNHSGSTYPAGAIDITDYYDFQAIQYRIGSPLRNHLASDRVHFSVSGG